jgi:hypothetical protein
MGEKSDAILFNLKAMGFTASEANSILYQVKESIPHLSEKNQKKREIGRNFGMMFVGVLVIVGAGTDFDAITSSFVNTGLYIFAWGLVIVGGGRILSQWM